ncbi:hypothetical protein ACFLZK_02060 [Patescibacteria group bacterium]
MGKKFKHWVITIGPKVLTVLFILAAFILVMSILPSAGSQEVQAAFARLPSVSESGVEFEEVLTDDYQTQPEVQANAQEMEPTGFRKVYNSLVENDIYMNIGTGPCNENDSVEGNDYVPQLVVNHPTECRSVIDASVGSIYKYDYLLILINGTANFNAYPVISPYNVGFGDIGDGYSIIALELPESVNGGPIATALGGGFPNTDSYRIYLIEYIKDLFSIQSMGALEDQFIGAIAANKEMVKVLIEEGFISQ